MTEKQTQSVNFGNINFTENSTGTDIKMVNRGTPSKYFKIK